MFHKWSLDKKNPKSAYNLAQAPLRFLRGHSFGILRNFLDFTFDFFWHSTFRYAQRKSGKNPFFVFCLIPNIQNWSPFTSRLTHSPDTALPGALKFFARYFDISSNNASSPCPNWIPAEKCILVLSKEERFLKTGIIADSCILATLKRPFEERKSSLIILHPREIQKRARILATFRSLSSPNNSCQRGSSLL